jgi:hypothetical protein
MNAVAEMATGCHVIMPFTLGTVVLFNAMKSLI